MAEEMRLHLERRIEENVHAGMTPEDARYAALRKFGGVEQFKEQCRDERPGIWLEYTLMDFRLAVRQLCKARGFAIVSILTLAIGIGASTSIFSVVNSVVLRPLAFPDSGRLVSINETFLPQYPEIPVSPALFFDWEEQSSALVSLGAANGYNGNLTGVGEPTRVFGYQISKNYLATLGVSPRLGRAFSAEESQQAKNVVILGHTIWVSHFGASEDAINRVVFLNGDPFTVVGVMSDGFHTEPGSPSLYVPLPSHGLLRSAYGNRSLRAVVGRLGAAATIEQAEDELKIVSARIAQAHPDTNKGMGAKITPMMEMRVRHARPLLLTLFGAVGALLLIACVNVANLSLTRASARRGEIELRTALGASRSRIIRQLLAESLLIAIISGVLGTWIAYQSMAALLSLAPISLPRIDEIKVDGMALAFSCAVTLLTGLGFGLLPAWQSSRVDLSKILNEGSQRVSDGPNRLRLRGVLVIIQLALALMLLVGAGLLTKSFHELSHLSLGFNPQVLYSSRFTLLPEKYPDDAARNQFVNGVLERLAGQPGIEALAFTTALPHHQNPPALMAIEERPEPDRLKMPRVIHAKVTPDYFKAMSNPLLAGRWFTDRDTASAPPVAIVSEQLMKEYFAGESPLGKRIDLESTGGRVWKEIVGVVSDIKSSGPAQPTIAQVYLPFDYGSSPQLMGAVRIQDGAPHPGKVIAAAVHHVDPEMPVNLNLIAEFVGHSIQVQKFALSIFVIFAVVALLLATIGIYGVMAYSVGQRTQEIGIRLALGAQRGDILRLVLRQATWLVAVGVGCGAAGSLVGSRLLRSLLYDVSPYDLATFVWISALLAAVAFLACWLPAHRAAKLDPMITLKAG
jgi:putative ABC transport system permease protein